MAYQSGPISSFAEKVPASTDYIPIVDTTDPFVKNKKASVGNLFKGVPYSSGSTSPAIAFGSSNNSGIFSPSGTQVGIRVGSTSNFNVTKLNNSIVLSASDTGASDLDLTLQAYGSSGKINFSSQTIFTDSNFSISSSTNSTNIVKFNLSNNGTSTISISSGGTLVTESGTQILSNKTITNPTITGQISVNTSDFVVTGGRVGIGIPVPDLTVKLHVSGNTKISGPSPSLQFSATTNQYSITNDNTNFNINLNQSNLISISSTNTTHVNDLYIGTGNSQGLILTAPNGNKFRVIVENSGLLSTVLV